MKKFLLVSLILVLGLLLASCGNPVGGGTVMPIKFEHTHTNTAISAILPVQPAPMGQQAPAWFSLPL
jgi:hypothetical protein